VDRAVEEDVEVRGWRATSCCRWESSALAWAEEDDEEDWRLLVLLLREVVVCRGMAGREWECSWDGDGDGMLVAARIECDGACDWELLGTREASGGTHSDPTTRHEASACRRLERDRSQPVDCGSFCE
jgi:hypothetical protein